MKRSEIIIIICVALVGGIVASTYIASSDSATFSEAKLEPGKKVKITGTFDKTHAVEYNPNVDANLTSFHVIDAKGESMLVQLQDDKGKPMGLEQSESVTIEGSFHNDGTFHSTHLLMKCPSKYNEQKHQLTAS